jgi:NAD(P)-dependent dehydrogenase (short-subunit alcohol dehydrogenase family)
VEKFGGIDILVNNASAISLTDTPSTTVKKYDLMHSVNGRGSWLVAKVSSIKSFDMVVKHQANLVAMSISMPFPT